MFLDISSKASSYRLLAGTNEFAEDLTGQRMPLNASQWKSETKVIFDRNEIVQWQRIRLEIEFKDKLIPFLMFASQQLFSGKILCNPTSTKFCSD